MKTKRVLILLASGLAIVAVAWFALIPSKRNASQSSGPAQNESSSPSERPPAFDRALANAEKLAGNPATEAKGISDLARLYHANAYYEKALEQYAKLAAIEPANAKWPHLQANLLAGFGRIDEAMSLEKRAMELDPKSLAPLLSLGEMQLKSNEEPAAAVTFAVARDLDSQSPFPLLGLARCAIQRDDWEEARRLLVHSIEIDWKFYPGWALLASVFERLGQADAMKEARARAEASDGARSFPDPWLGDLAESCFDAYQLSVSASLAKDHNEAIRLLKRSIAIDPENGSYHRQLGIRLRTANRPQEALAALQTATRHAPDDAETWSALIDFLLERGDAAGISNALEQALPRCPHSAYLHFINGLRFSQLGQIRDAESEFAIAKQLQPNEARSYIQLAKLYVEQNRLSKAKHELESALSAEPGNPGIVVLLARLAIMMEESNVAKKWIHKLPSMSKAIPEDTQLLRQHYRQTFGVFP